MDAFPWDSKTLAFFSFERIEAHGQRYSTPARHRAAVEWKAALKLGATTEEIMEVLKLCVVAGVQAFNLAVPILDEELGHKVDRKTA